MRNNNFFIVFFGMLFLQLSLSAASVTISGQAVDYIGKEIIALSYADHFSEDLNLLATADVDSTGNFTLTFEIDQTRLIKLRCDYVNAHLYVQPDASYQVLFPNLSSGQKKSVNNTAMVELFFNNLDPSDINAQVISFNQFYAKFFDDNNALLMKMAKPGSRIPIGDGSGRTKSVLQLYKEKLAVFTHASDSIFPSSNQDFFFIYRKSVEADLLFMISANRKDIFDKYIAPYRINIAHPEQARMIRRFFEDYTGKIKSNHDGEKLKELLKEEESLSQIKALYAQDDFLVKEEFQELIIANSIIDAWNNNSIKKEDAINVLSDLSKTGVTEAGQAVAQNFLTAVLRSQKGYPAYSFSLLDEYNALRSLEEFKGKYVVLEFWATWCKSCLKELALSSNLQSKYKNDVQFISIAIDDNNKDTEAFLRNHEGLHQIFLNANSEKLLMDKYNIRKLPAYVIIDRSSNILNPFAPSPSEVLEEQLHSLTVKRGE